MAVPCRSHWWLRLTLVQRSCSRGWELTQEDAWPAFCLPKGGRKSDESIQVGYVSTWKALSIVESWELTWSNISEISSAGRPWFFNLAHPFVLRVWRRALETSSLCWEVPLRRDKSSVSDMLVTFMFYRLKCSSVDNLGRGVWEILGITRVCSSDMVPNL